MSILIKDERLYDLLNSYRLPKKTRHHCSTSLYVSVKCVGLLCSSLRNVRTADAKFRLKFVQALFFLLRRKDALGDSMTNNKKNIDKVFFQSHYRPEVPRGFQVVKVPRLRDNGPQWWYGFQPHAPAAFTPRKYSW